MKPAEAAIVMREGRKEGREDRRKGGRQGNTYQFKILP